MSSPVTLGPVGFAAGSAPNSTVALFCGSAAPSPLEGSGASASAAPLPMTFLVFGKLFDSSGDVDIHQGRNDTTWTRCLANPPVPPLHGHTLVALAEPPRTWLLIGGFPGGVNSHDSSAPISMWTVRLDRRAPTEPSNDSTANIPRLQSEAIPAVGVSDSSIPRARAGHSTVLVGKKVILFGGEDARGALLNDTYVLDTEIMTWSRVAFDPSAWLPAPRSKHAATVLGSVVLISGGRDGEGRAIDEIAVLDTTYMTWKVANIVGAVPSGRIAHVAVRTSPHRAVLLGGIDAQGEPVVDSIAVLTYRGASIECSVFDTPEARRYEHAALAWSTHVIVFGGLAGSPLSRLFTVRLSTLGAIDDDAPAPQRSLENSGDAPLEVPEESKPVPGTSPISGTTWVRSQPRKKLERIQSIVLGDIGSQSSPTVVALKIIPRISDVTSVLSLKFSLTSTVGEVLNATLQQLEDSSLSDSSQLVATVEAYDGTRTDLDHSATLSECNLLLRSCGFFIHVRTSERVAERASTDSEESDSAVDWRTFLAEAKPKTEISPSEPTIEGRPSKGGKARQIGRAFTRHTLRRNAELPQIVSRTNSLAHVCAEGARKGGLVLVIQEQGRDCLRLVDENGQTPLHAAVNAPQDIGESDLVPILQTMFSNKVQINALDNHDWSALHFAAANGRFQLCQMLIDAGSDTTARTDDDTTALHLVTRFWSNEASPSILEALLKGRSSVKVDSKTRHGETALHFAAQAPESVASLYIRTLVRTYHANPSLPNEDGETPLHFAVRSDSAAAVKALIECGADVNARGPDGTPRDVAVLISASVHDLFDHTGPSAPSSSDSRVNWKERCEHEMLKVSRANHALEVATSSCERETESHRETRSELERLRMAMGSLLCRVSELEDQVGIRDASLQVALPSYQLALHTALLHKAEPMLSRSSLRQWPPASGSAGRDPDNVSRLSSLWLALQTPEASSKFAGFSDPSCQFRRVVRDDNLISALNGERVFRHVVLLSDAFYVAERPADASGPAEVLRLFTSLEGCAVYFASSSGTANDGFDFVAANNASARFFAGSQDLASKWLSDIKATIDALPPFDSRKVRDLVEAPASKSLQFSPTLPSQSPVTVAVPIPELILPSAPVSLPSSPSDKRGASFFESKPETSRETVNRTSTSADLRSQKPSHAPTQSHLSHFLPSSLLNRGGSGVAQALKAVESNSSQTLELVNCGIKAGSKVIVQISQALMASTSVTHVDLSRNSIDDKGVICLVQAMMDNSRNHIKFLILAKNHIGAAGARAVANLLRTQTSATTRRVCRIEELDLSDNVQIGDRGAQALGDALQVNGSLRSLNLQNTGFTDQGVRFISFGLYVNSALEALLIGSDSLTTRGRETLYLTLLKSSCSVLGTLICDEEPRPDVAARLCANLELSSLRRFNLTSGAWNSQSGRQLQGELLETVRRARASSPHLFAIGHIDPTPLLSEESILPNSIGLSDVMIHSCGLVGLPPRIVSFSKAIIGAGARQGIGSTVVRNITSLALPRNALAAVPAAIATLGGTLRRLDLSHNALTVIPSFIGKLTKLRVLSVACNAIAWLPGEIGLLRKLRTLLLQGNLINRLPPELYQLRSLEDLFLIDNPLPNAHMKLAYSWVSKSERLELTSLGIPSLPVELGRLFNLRELRCSGNALRSLPPQIGGLPALSVILAADNDLEGLPWQLSLLPSLEVLDVTGNPVVQKLFPATEKILQAPDAIGQLQATLQGHRQSRRPLRRMRLMFVGADNVGKTTLIRQIRQNYAATIPAREDMPPSLSLLYRLMEDEEFSAPSTPNLSTNGIDISGLVLDAPVLANRESASKKSRKTRQEPIGFHVWDFAGQDVYYGTHQFFIGGRAVFVVCFNVLHVDPVAAASFRNRDESVSYADSVVNGEDVAGSRIEPGIESAGASDVSASETHRRMEDSLEFWLWNIAARSPGSTIMLVGTHSDKCSAGQLAIVHEFVTARFLSRFPSVKQFVAISNKTKKNVNTLVQMITSAAAYDPHIDDELSVGFAQLCEILDSQRMERQPPVVSMDEFAGWIASCGLLSHHASGAEAVAMALSDSNTHREIEPWVKMCADLGLLLHLSPPGVVSASDLSRTVAGVNVNVKDSSHNPNRIHDLSLGQFIVLDPKWLTKLMATLITTTANFVRFGMIQESDLPQIWKPPAFPSPLHPALLGLLETLELIFPLPQDDPGRRNVSLLGEGRVTGNSSDDSVRPGVFLVAEFMSGGRPDLSEFRLTSPVIRRVYKFPLVPYGLFGRLSVRLLHFLRCTARWYNGMLLTTGGSSPGTVVMCETDISSRCLAIEVRGRHHVRVLRLIVENVEVLLRGWYRMPYEVLLSCQCERCVRYLPSSRRTIFTLRQCEQAAVEGLHTVVCTSSFGEREIDQQVLPAQLRGGALHVRLDSLAPEVVLTDLTEYKVKFTDLQFNEIIGRGGFAEVYSGIYLPENKLVAIKQLRFGAEGRDQKTALVPKREHDIAKVSAASAWGAVWIDTAHADEFLASEAGSSISVYREFMREVWLSSCLNHPAIVQLIGCCLDPCCLIMEYVPHGSLSRVLQGRAPVDGSLDAPSSFPQISLGWKLCAARSIASAIQFMHAQTPRLVHRDLKSPNCLVSRTPNDPAFVSFSDSSPHWEGIVVCKVADFGDAAAVATVAAGRGKISNPCWLAPEVMLGSAYTHKADVFSMGIIIGELLTQRLPYSEFEISHGFKHVFEDAIVKGLRPTLPDDSPRQLLDLVQSCWLADPNSRPELSEICEALEQVQSQLQS